MSKAKRNGGYVLVDFSGVNLANENPQVIPGIFTAMDTALKTNKPIIAINAVIAVDDIEPVPYSPFIIAGGHNITETGADPDDILIHLTGGESAHVTRDGDTESLQIGE